MKLFLASLLIVLGFAVPVHAARPAAHKSTAPSSRAETHKDWTTTAVRLPSGAYMLGNPNAKVRMVEYLSLVCPHCAHFEQEAVPPFLTKYVRNGLVSYEVRHSLLNGLDLAASVLARCEGPTAFFRAAPKAFAEQERWFGRAQAWMQVQGVAEQPLDQFLPKLAQGAALGDVFGLPADRVQSCLANKGELELMVKQSQLARQEPGFRGTPGILINGRLRDDVFDWPTLDRALRAAASVAPARRQTT